MSVDARFQREFGCGTIQVLSPVECIRRRPGMYVGDLDDPASVHRLLQHALRSVTHRAREGARCRAELLVCEDGSYVLTDDARPFSTDPRRGAGERSPLDLALTAINVLPWDEARPWDYAGGALVVLNALCEALEIETRESDLRCTWAFARGVPTGALRVDAAPPARSTRLAFRLDRALFAPRTTPDVPTVVGLMRAVAAGHPGLELSVRDPRSGRRLEIGYPEGARDLLREAAGLEGVALERVFRAVKVFATEGGGVVRADVALACFPRYRGERCELALSDTCYSHFRLGGASRSVRRGFREALGPERLPGRALASAVVLQGHDHGRCVALSELRAWVAGAAREWAAVSTR